MGGKSLGSLRHLPDYARDALSDVQAGDWVNVVPKGSKGKPGRQSERPSDDPVSLDEIQQAVAGAATAAIEDKNDPWGFDG